MANSEIVPTILIVDDEDLPRRAIGRAIGSEVECRVLEASSGEAALKMLDEHHVDVVLSDYNMPGMSGVDFLRHVSLCFSGVVRLMITSSNELEVAIKAINLGEVTHFLRKPWSDEELVRTVCSAFDEAKRNVETNQLREAARRAGRTLKNLEQKFPGITGVQRDRDGGIHIDEKI